MPKTILVIDDDQIIVELSKRILQDQGFEVMTAGDGRQALVQLGQKIPAMILLDVEMPVVNGYTFMLEKSKVPAYAEIPVVVLTSHKETNSLFNRHGVRAYLSKPLKPQELKDIVAKVLGPAS